VLVYGLVPFMLLSIVGTDALAKDPMVAFLPAAKAIFGDTGAAIVAIMLIAALLLGVMTAIIGSSRTVYEMSRDGLTLRQFARLNKHGVPVGSMYWDAAVTLTLLLVFKDNVVNIVAASNVGYIIPFILIPIAYVRLRRVLPDFQRPFKLAPIFGTAAIVIAAYNAFLLAVGGPLWGGKVMLTGGIIMVTFVPFYAIRRSRDRRRQVATAAAPA
jgi:amino acid transporter